MYVRDDVRDVVLTDVRGHVFPFPFSFPSAGRRMLPSVPALRAPSWVGKNPMDLGGW